MPFPTWLANLISCLKDLYYFEPHVFLPDLMRSSVQYSVGQYRLINDWGGSGTPFHGLGKTPDPCASEFVVLKAIAYWASTPESSQYDGASGSSPSGQTYQLSEGRVGLTGQAVNATINGSTAPWIWSVIKFDSSGNPTYSERSVFPTMSIYTNGHLTGTVEQMATSCWASGTPSSCFSSGKNSNYQLTPSQIQ